MVSRTGKNRIVNQFMDVQCVMEPRATTLAVLRVDVEATGNTRVRTFGEFPPMSRDSFPQVCEAAKSIAVGYGDGTVVELIDEENDYTETYVVSDGVVRTLSDIL